MTDSRYRTHVRLDDIRPSPTNPRKHFADTELASLASNIKEHGVITPILLRTYPGAEGEGYELISGERRWRASKLAGKESIPAIIRDDLSSNAILEIQLIENLQREDLHPLEEAEGYERMMKEHGYTADQIADKIDKSRSYIFSTLKLADLCEDGKRLFHGGTLNRSTALLVARIPTDKLQAKAIADITAKDYNQDIMSVRKAQRHIRDRYMLHLNNAPFPTGDAELIGTAGACAGCPHRTGNRPELFDDVESADVCTDPDCYALKKLAHAARIAEKTGATVITGEAATKILPAYSCESRTHVRLDDTCYDDPKHRTYREIMADEKEAVALIEHTQGALVEVVTKKAVTAKLKADGVVTRKDTEKDDAKKLQGKVDLANAWRDKMFRTARTLAADEAHNDGISGLMLDLLPIIAMRFFLELGFDRGGKVAGLWGAIGTDNHSRWTTYQMAIPAMTVEQSFLFLLDCALIGEQRTDQYNYQREPAYLLSVAKAMEMDPDALFEQCKAEQKAAESAKNPAKKPKKSSPAPSEDHLYPSGAAQAAEPLRAEEQGGATEAAPAGDEIALEEEQSCAAVAARVETPSEDDVLPLEIKAEIDQLNSLFEQKLSEGEFVTVIKNRNPTLIGKTGVINAVHVSGYQVRLDRIGLMHFDDDQIEKASPPEGDSIEMDEKPSETNSLQPKVGECIKIRSTAKNWKVAGKLALVLSTPKPDRATYIIKHDASAGDMAEVGQDEIAEIVGCRPLAWMTTPDTAATWLALKVGDTVKIKDDAKGAGGHIRKCAGKEGVIEAARGNVFAVRFAPGRDGVVANLQPEELERATNFVGCSGVADPIPHDNPGRRFAVVIAYRHPENHELQWTGRGRKPKWVEHYLANGGTLDDLKADTTTQETATEGNEQ